MLWYTEYFSVPRRRIRKHLGIPRGTLYRWLHRLEEGRLDRRATQAQPANRTPRELARVIWQIFGSNPQWGKCRIAMTIRALGVFIAASTVRNILLRPRPRGKEPTAAILPATELLTRWDIRQRFDAVGKHGSVAVTERAILTLKHEWLNRVALIRGLDHLSGLLDDFGAWYNSYRGHTTLGGARPALVYHGERWNRPPETAKKSPRVLPRLHTCDCTRNLQHPPIHGVTAPLHRCLAPAETGCRPCATEINLTGCSNACPIAI